MQSRTKVASGLALGVDVAESLFTRRGRSRTKLVLCQQSSGIFGDSKPGRNARHWTVALNQPALRNQEVDWIGPDRPRLLFPQTAPTNCRAAGVSKHQSRARLLRALGLSLSGRYGPLPGAEIGNKGAARGGTNKKLEMVSR